MAVSHVTGEKILKWLIGYDNAMEAHKQSVVADTPTLEEQVAQLMHGENS